MKLKTLWILMIALLMTVSAAADPVHEYDENGNVIKTTYDDGSFTEYEYDEEGRKTAAVLSNGVREEYDENGRPVLVVFPDGTSTRNEYDDAGRLIRASYSDGSFTEFEYDEEGRMHRFIYPDGSFDEYEYDENGLTCRIFDENGDTLVEYEHHENGNISKERRYESDRLIVSEYDENGVLLSQTDDHYTDDSYDRVYEYRNGVLIRMTSSHTIYEYYDTGVIRMEHYLEIGDTLYYNEFGTISKWQYADGSYTIYRNDDMGNPLTFMEYDSSGKFVHQDLTWTEALVDIQISRDRDNNIIYSGSSLPDIRVERFESGYVDGIGYHSAFAWVQAYNHAKEQRSVYEYDEEGNILKIHREYFDKETIRMAQEALNAAGYDCGAPDGILGRGTAAAITKYQMHMLLSKTGTVTHEMLVSLGVMEELSFPSVAPADDSGEPSAP